MIFLSKRLEIVFLFTLCLMFFTMSIGAIFSESRIFDEGLHVQAGYRFLTDANFASEPFNPPLARELTALPSYFFPSTLNDPLYVWQRIVVVVISILFLILLYQIIRKLFGTIPAMFGALLYAFNPEIQAHSHYAVTDLILSFFIFLSVMLYILWKEQLTYSHLVILGCCIGFALSVKVSAVPFLILSFGFLFLVDIYQKKSFRHLLNKSSLKKFGILLIVIVISLWSTYFFTRESIMGEGFTPRNELVKRIAVIPGVSFLLSEPVPLGGYLRTVKQVFLYNYSDVYSKPAFLLGEVSPQGWWYFYPVALLIKTPIPLLFLLVISIVFIRSLSYKILFLPVAAIILSSMMSTLNLGIRYILPIYPLLIIYLSQVVRNEISFRYKNVFIIILLAWYIAGTLVLYPHTLSYMNEFAGNATQRQHRLLDSNYDWGQGLVGLATYQKNHPQEKVQLAYFGMADPAMYELKYQRIGDLSLGDKKNAVPLVTKKGYTTVISASCYYFCGYYKLAEFSNKPPDGVVGGSLLIFRW